MPIPGYLLYQEASLLFASIVIITILGITDLIDGIMARKDGPTVLGGLLDPIADKIFIAVLYIPLADRVIPEWDRAIIPLWMLICMFSRDFLVTSLRTSLSLRNAPMRTSTLAKYKTAIQMTAVGYILFYAASFMINLDPMISIGVFIIPVLIPLCLMIYRLFTNKPQGKRSITMASLMAIAVVVYFFMGPKWTSYIMILSITVLTVYSGLSYMSDAWSAIKGTSDSIKESMAFLLEGVMVPIALLLPLGRFDTSGMSTLIIMAITMELATGGLGNLLASNNIAPCFRWIALKSVFQVVFSGGAFVISFFPNFSSLPIGEIGIASATIVSIMYAVISFIKHKQIYMSQIRESVK